MKKNPGRRERRLDATRFRKQSGRRKAALDAWKQHVGKK